MARKLNVLAVVAVATLLLAACGDDGGSNGTGSGSDSDGDVSVTTSSLSKQQFIKEMNALCVESREKRLEAIETYAEDNQPEGKDAEEELLVGVANEVFAPTTEAQVQEMRELGAPKGDEAKIEAILAAYQRSAEIAAELEGGDPQGPLNQAFSKAGEKALDYGFEECAVG